MGGEAQDYEHVASKEDILETMDRYWPDGDRIAEELLKRFCMMNAHEWCQVLVADHPEDIRPDECWSCGVVKNGEYK